MNPLPPTNSNSQHHKCKHGLNETYSHTDGRDVRERERKREEGSEREREREREGWGRKVCNLMSYAYNMYLGCTYIHIYCLQLYYMHTYIVYKES